MKRSAILLKPLESTPTTVQPKKTLTGLDSHGKCVQGLDFCRVPFEAGALVVS